MQIFESKAESLPESYSGALGKDEHVSMSQTR